MKHRLLIFLGVLLAANPFPAVAADIEVQNLDNDGGGSLRLALLSSLPSADNRITFNASLNGGTLSMSTGEFAEQVDAGKTLEIDASNLPNGISIDAGNMSRIFRFTGDGLVILRNVTLRDGKPGNGDTGAPHGGAIHASTALELINCSVLSNQCSNQHPGVDGGNGGAIFSTADITLEEATFSGNGAGTGGDGTGANGNDGGSGGAIFTSGNVVATDSAFLLNQAGAGGTADAANVGGTGGSAGALSVSGTLELTGCSFTSNAAGAGGNATETGNGGNGGDGGAIHHTGSMTAFITETSFSQNAAGSGGTGGVTSGNGGNAGNGGAILASGTEGTIERSSFSQNATGDGGAMGPMGVDGLGADGGAIFFEPGGGTPKVDVTNTLFVSNGASSNGGALYCETDAEMKLVHVTITENTSTGVGGGIDGGSSGKVEFEATIVAQNTTTSGGPSHHNFGNSGATFSPINQNIVQGDPGLGSAGFFGGGILAMLPESGSPAINTAIANASTPATDQRGFTRNFGSGPDIGAAELSFQADNRIGLRSNPASHKVDNFYSTSGARQKITSKTKGRRRGKVFLSAQNDGDLDVLIVRSTNPGRKLKFKVTRLTGGRKNVAADFKKGGYRTDPVARDGIVSFQILAGAKSNKRRVRKKISLKVSSAATPGRADRSIVTVKSVKK